MPASTRTFDFAENIENLLKYACDNLDLKSENINYTRNSLYNLFKLENVIKSEPNNIDIHDSLRQLTQFAVSEKICRPTDERNFQAQIMGFLTPMPDTIISNFDEIFFKKGSAAAMDYYYNLNIKNNYIDLKNFSDTKNWEFQGKFGKIILSINLKKKENNKSQQGFCPICCECEGSFFNAKSNLRLLPLELGDSFWNIQFAPVQYFNRHFILSSVEHKPMGTNREKFQVMLDFAKTFDSYFIASNTELERIGGSLLNHEHMQGGLLELPLMQADAKKHYYHQKFQNISISLLDWYVPAIKIYGKNEKELIDFVCLINESFADYIDESINLIAKSYKPHSSLNSVCFKENANFVFVLVPRNNRTSAERPLGIFCPDESCKVIKKEGIGIFEIMGYFILPERLKTDIEEIKKYLTGNKALNFNEINPDNEVLTNYAPLIAQIVSDYGINMTNSKSEEVIKDFINTKCEEMLIQSAVFKNDEKGISALDKFLNLLSLKAV